MLTTLGKRKGGERSLVERFTDCHQRIRSFCAIAKRVARSAGGAEARDAALELHRYFSVGLPLHVADEEQSLTPRLVALGDRELMAALETMKREHVEADRALASLLTAWQAIAADPTTQQCLATDEAIAWLAAHFDEHLAKEETRILPLLEKLSPVEAQAIVSEMVARRQ